MIKNAVVTTLIICGFICLALLVLWLDLCVIVFLFEYTPLPHPLGGAVFLILIVFEAVLLSEYAYNRFIRARGDE